MCTICLRTGRGITKNWRTPRSSRCLLPSIRLKLAGSSEGRNQRNIRIFDSSLPLLKNTDNKLQFFLMNHWLINKCKVIFISSVFLSQFSNTDRCTIIISNPYFATVKFLKFGNVPRIGFYGLWMESDARDVLGIFKPNPKDATRRKMDAFHSDSEEFHPDDEAVAMMV